MIDEESYICKYSGFVILLAVIMKESTYNDVVDFSTLWEDCDVVKSWCCGENDDDSLVTVSCWVYVYEWFFNIAWTRIKKK